MSDIIVIPNASLARKNKDNDFTGINTFTNIVVPYGSMWADDVTILVTIASGGLYYEVGSGLTGGLTQNFTFQNNKELKCLVAGKYKVDWSLSLRPSGNNENVSGTVMVNSTHVSTTEGSAECINSGKPVCVSGSGIVTLSINDVVKLAVENEDAAHNITITHATLSLVMVGG